MRKFKVTTSHTVYIDSYKQGEGKHVNFYTLKSEVITHTIQEAIQEHFNNTVYLPFDYSKCDADEANEAIFWSNLVDENNEEPSKYDIEKWKKEEKELYSNNSYITIHELIRLKFD